MKTDDRCHQKYKFQITFPQKTVRLLSTKDPYYVHNYPTKLSFTLPKYSVAPKPTPKIKTNKTKKQS